MSEQDVRYKNSYDNHSLANKTKSTERSHGGGAPVGSRRIHSPDAQSLSHDDPSTKNPMPETTWAATCKEVGVSGTTQRKLRDVTNNDERKGRFVAGWL